MLFLNKPNKYGLPNGVKPRANGKYEAKYNNEYLGIFNSVEEAELAHTEAKRKHIREVAEEYKSIVPTKVYDALMNW